MISIINTYIFFLFLEHPYITFNSLTCFIYWLLITHTYNCYEHGYVLTPTVCNQLKMVQSVPAHTITSSHACAAADPRWPEACRHGLKMMSFIGVMKQFHLGKKYFPTSALNFLNITVATDHLFSFIICCTKFL